MTKPDDTELERYLAGDHPVCIHYRAATDDEPPAELDAAIRRHAHESVPDRHRRWRRPVAAAAVVVLGMGLEFELQHQPGVQPPANRQLTEQAAPQASLDSSMSRSAPQQRLRAVPRKTEPPRIPSSAIPEKQAPSPALRPPAPAAKAQITRIQQLLASDKRDAAISALKQLLERHPHYPLPARLKRLAETAALLQ